MNTTGYQFTATRGHEIVTERNFATEMSAIRSANEYIELGWFVECVFHTNTSIIVKRFNSVSDECYVQQSIK